MNQVRSIIISSLQANGLSHYASQAEPVIHDLETILDHSVDTLREQGVALGASEEQVEAVLIEAGLVERAPEPEPEAEATFQGEDSTVADSLARIESLVVTVQSNLERRLSALEAAGRRAGVL